MAAVKLQYVLGSNRSHRGGAWQRLKYNMSKGRIVRVEVVHVGSEITISPLIGSNQITINHSNSTAAMHHLQSNNPILGLIVICLLPRTTSGTIRT